jgi:hypothetical protein
MIGGNQSIPGKVALSESTQTKSVAVTGDRKSTLSEAVIEESNDQDIGQILHLAGLKRS